MAQQNDRGYFYRTDNQREDRHSYIDQPRADGRSRAYHDQPREQNPGGRNYRSDQSQQRGYQQDQNEYRDYPQTDPEYRTRSEWQGDDFYENRNYAEHQGYAGEPDYRDTPGGYHAGSDRHGRGYRYDNQFDNRSADYYRSGNLDSESSDRGWAERASDEVRSWFGDEDASRRREDDHRGKGPKNYTRSDERIREDVSDRMAYDSALDASSCEVEVSDGEVTLNGRVDSLYAKRRAEDCAHHVSGVGHVQNNLRVKDNSGPDAANSASSMSTNTRQLQKPAATA